MGVLADIYVSRDDQQAVQYDSAPESFPEREQFTNFTVLEISTLWAAIRDTAWDVASLDDFSNLLVIDGGERTIHRFPKALSDDLARLTPQQIATASQKWAATDEMRCQPSDVQPIVEGLVRLAKRASETSGQVYFWNCV
jgi:hypothetical protein